MGTIRQQIMDRLSNGPVSGIDISKAVGIREKSVYEHLPHIAQTVAAHGKVFILHPAQCLGCSYVFRKRERFTRPSRCPKCRGTYIQRPTYELR